MYDLSTVTRASVCPLPEPYRATVRPGAVVFEQQGIRTLGGKGPGDLQEQIMFTERGKFS